MNRKRSRFVPPFSLANDPLESRVALSAAGAPSAAVAAHPGLGAGTRTTLSATAGTLGQPVTVNVTVRAAASAGVPQGTVNILDHGKVIQTLTATPTTSNDPRFAFATGSVTLTPQPGGSAYFFGRHSLTAQFIPSGGLRKSRGVTAFTVGQPQYTTLASGVKVATIAPGSGPQIQSGQTANILYTGYLAKNGRIFDDSISHGGAPFGFTLGAGAVIPGFDAGVAGMQAGETRIVEIPPSQGYGPRANGPIPGNSTLVFVLTLTSIS
jgi:hypothetical protein